MSLEQALGIKLTLVTELGNSARDFSGTLDAVSRKLKAIKEAGQRFDLSGLQALSEQVQIDQRTTSAAQKVANLSESNAKVATSSKQAATGINEVAEAASVAGANAQRAAQWIGSLDGVLRRVGASNSALAIISDDFSDIASMAQRATIETDALAAAMGRVAGVQRALRGGAMYAALPPAYESRYGPIPQRASRVVGNVAALAPAEMLALTGGTDPYFDARAWWANQRAKGTSAGSGPPIIVPPGGFGGAGGGGPFDRFGGSKGVSRIGDSLSSAGWGLLMNGGMLASVLVPAIKNAMDIDDLLHRTYEALKAGGATEANAKKFTDATRQIARDVGSNYKETVSAGYNFISALPSGTNLADPKTMQVIIDSYKRVAKMIVAGSASTHHITMEEGALDANNVIENLGLDTSSPAALRNAYKTATNVLINLKNRTSTEVDMAAASIKAIGPIAKQMGVSPEEIVGLIGMEAEGKVRGQTAGYAIKRLLQRQAVPSKKTIELVDAINGMGGNIDLFDKSGHARNLYEYMSDITKFMDTHHLNTKQRSYITGQLAGLYALPNLDLMMDQIRKHGGPEGAKKYGHSLIHGTLAGGKTGDALEDSYAARAKGNVKVRAEKVSADLQDVAYKTFKDMEPFLDQDLVLFDKLVLAFEALPPPVRAAIGDFLVLKAAFDTLSGPALLLLGNFVRVNGAIGSLISTGVKVAEFASRFGLVSNAVRLLGTAIFGVPIIGWIAALVTAGTLLYEAWTHDWGGIREKTSGALNFVGDQIHRFISWAGTEWKKFAPAVISALEIMFPMFGMLDPKFRAKADGWMASLGHGIQNGVKWIVDGLAFIASRIWSTITNWGAQALHAGVAFIENLGKGIQQGINAAPALVKKGLQKIRDLFPGSEPKDSSSPLYGMGKSGEAFSDMFVQGVIDGLRNGDKVKKAAKQHVHKPIMDTLIDLHGESIAEVEKTAKGIEDALIAAGARIKMGWMDLLSGGHAQRFYGNTAAVHAAVRQNHHKDTSAQDAADYLKRLREFPQSYEQVMKRLGDYLIAATTAHARSTIEGMIGHIMSAYHASLKKFANTAQSGKGGINDTSKELDQVNKMTHTFTDEQTKANEKLQEAIDKRKNEEVPSLKELEREQKIVRDEKEKLQKIYEQELATRDKIVAQMIKLEQRINSLNDADKQQHALKQQLQGQLLQLGNSLNTVNIAIERQTADLGDLNDQLNTYNKNIKDTKDGTDLLARSLNDAFDKGINEAITVIENKVDSSVSKMFQRIFGKWSQSGSVVMQAIGTFAETFLGTMVSDIMDSILKNAEQKLTDWFKQMTDKWFGGSNGNGAGGFFDSTGQWIAKGGAAQTLTVFATAMALGAGIGNMEGAGTGAAGNHALNGALGAALGVGGALFAAGGLAPLLAMGPAGWAILGGAALLGGIGGGMIGPHWGPPSNYPDRSDPTYQGFLNSYNNGAANDTGHQIENWLKSVNPATLSGDQLALYNYFKGLGGSNGDIGIANEHNGVFTFGSGKTANVTDFRNEVDQWTKAVQQSTSALNSATDANRLAASFTSLLLNGPAGFNIPLLRTDVNVSGSIVTTLSNALAGVKGAPPRSQPNVRFRVSVFRGATVPADMLDEVRAVAGEIAGMVTTALNSAYATAS